MMSLFSIFNISERSMNINFHQTETFRDDFTFHNSDDAIRRFPFPFDRDNYMYSVNMQPHDGRGICPAYRATFDIDEHYIAECNERSLVLKADSKRCQVLPHMIDAEWDTLELIMEALSADYPDLFVLTRHDDAWTWINRPLGLEDSFTFGRSDTLPLPPFEYITRQVQGDFTLQDHRDDDLWIDGGMVTAQSGWSLDFILGMSFADWHKPVPHAGAMGVFDRALKFLLNLRSGHPVRRLNWGMMVHPRLDASLETSSTWAPDHFSVAPEKAAETLNLRVELQSLFRLPRSNAILFSIRVYFISLADICRVPDWAARMHRVLLALNPQLSHYKALDPFRQVAINILAPFDDGRPLPDGMLKATTLLAR